MVAVKRNFQVAAKAEEREKDGGEFRERSEKESAGNKTQVLRLRYFWYAVQLVRGKINKK